MINYTVIKSKRKTIAIQVKDNGEVIVRAPLFCSKKKIENFVVSKSDWIIKAFEKQRERARFNVELSESQIKKMKIDASGIINEKVRYYSRVMNVSPRNVKITSAKKRFGSCNSKGNLCFSYRLMLYPDEAIDYVVVHELAHLIELNHSKAFYYIVEKVLPDYKEREKLLKG